MLSSIKVLRHIITIITVIGLVGISACNKDNEVTDSGSDNLSDFPQIKIITNGQIVNEPKVAGSMTIDVGNEEIFSGHIGIEYRGSSSYRLFEKKSYGVETWDAGGADLNVSLFDFPEEEDWVLNGPFSDKTLIRNVLSFDLSNQMGMYAPRTKLTELTLNGSYMGVYVLMEKLKRNKNRIPVAKLTNAHVDPDTITGGYILKIDKTAGDTNNDDWAGDALYTENISFRSGYDQFGAPLSTTPFSSKTSAETYFLYEYPDAGEINSTQKSYIKKYINDFETALANETFTAATRSYEDYIDVSTFVDFFILNELSHNADAYRLSTFLYKNRGDKLKMGPLWDLNLTYGNDGDSYRNSPTTWIYQYNTYVPNDLWLVPFWWQKLMQDPSFKTKIKTRWNTLRSTTLAKSNIMAIIDDRVSLLKDSGAVARNFERWKILGVPVAFNGFVGQTYDEEVNFMKSWIDQRLTWMDSQIGSF